jgi:hypothetical protein
MRRIVQPVEQTLSDVAKNFGHLANPRRGTLPVPTHRAPVEYLWYGHPGGCANNHPELKVFLLLFLQKKNNSSFSEEKEAKRLLFLAPAS